MKQISLLSMNNIKKQYRAYLQECELGESTILTLLTDTFYIWNNGSKEFNILNEIQKFELFLMEHINI